MMTANKLLERTGEPLPKVEDLIPELRRHGIELDGFAAREAEGDGTLEYWRRAHWAFFSRECERIGRTPSETMPVVCCSFEVLNVVPEFMPDRLLDLVPCKGD